MPLLQLSEMDERKVMKRLLEYVYFRMLEDRGNLEHHHDSTLEHACRFLVYFDPAGETETGYKPRMKISEIRDLIDESDKASLPCIEVFLDTALHINAHLHGIGTDSLYEPMNLDPRLEPTLHATGLLKKNGMASDALLIDAIDRWYFFDSINREHSKEVKDFLIRLGETVWLSASKKDRDYLVDGLVNEHKSLFEMGNWFSSRWRFGFWLNKGEWEKDSNLFGSNSAIGDFVVASIKTGLEDGRIQISNS